MKFAIYTIFFLTLLSCKKEKQISTDKVPADSLTVQTKKKSDTVPTKPNQQVFNFVTDLCTSKGYFDANKYTEEEIKGAYTLWFDLRGIMLDTPSVFSLQDLTEIRRDNAKILAKLDKDFAEKKAFLEQLTVVNVPYWQNIKKLQYESLLQKYEMEKLRIAAYSDPSILLKSNTGNKCRNFTTALNSTDEQMFSEWKKLREQMSKMNADPERIINLFNEHLNSPDKKDYAAIDLITFGWGNCMNGEIQSPSHDGRMNQEFESLFIKIDADCDEP